MPDVEAGVQADVVAGVVEARRDASSRIPLHDLLQFEFVPPEPGSRTAQVHLPVRREAYGFTETLHGGAIATLIDLACAMAAAMASGFDPSAQSLVTADMHIRYLGRARTDRVTANAEVVKIGKQLIVVECKVVDGTWDGEGDDRREHVVASADFSSMIVPKRGEFAHADGDDLPFAAPDL